MARSEPTPATHIRAAYRWSEESGLPPIAYPFACLHELMCSPSNNPQTQAEQGIDAVGGATMTPTTEVVPALLEQPGTVASPTEEDQQ